MRQIVLAVVLFTLACGNRADKPFYPVLDVPLEDIVEDTGDGLDVVSDALFDAAEASDGAPEETVEDVGDVETADAGDVPLDAEVVDPPDAPHPLFDFVGTIRMLERVQPDGSFSTSQVSVRLESGLGRITHFEGGAAGRCIFYQSYIIGPDCTPECDPISEWCHPDGSCREWPHRVSAGDVTFGGLETELTASPDETAWYTLEPSGFSGDLFTAEAGIQVAAAGDEVPGFDAEVSGISDLVVGWDGNVKLVDGQDNVLEWAPADEGSTVEFVIQTGWHGAPPTAIIWCSVPDEEGQVIIAQELVEMFPQVPEIGLFQWPSEVRRVQRTVVETQFGPVEVVAASQLTFQTLH